MKIDRIVLFSFFVIGTTFLSCNSEKKSSRNPNVIILITDDQGYGDLACHGNTIIQTPNFDKLYQESIRFTDFHVDPTCAPTRGALMTGQYSRRAKTWHTIMGRNYLRRNFQTMANFFRNSGYKTGHFGKWHLGGNYPFRPIDRGFDYWVGHGDGGTGTTTDYWGNDKMNDTYLRNGKLEKFEGFSTDIFFNEAIQFIDRNKNHPFFVYLSTNVPHSPHYVPEEWTETYKGKGLSEHFRIAYFYASINRIDYNLGILNEYLINNNLSNNTIFIFLTDNGTSSGIVMDENLFPIGPGYNAGMRGNKNKMYEGGHRVPLFIKWPAGNIRKNTDISYLTAHFDLLPTLIELCNLKKPTETSFDGMSLVPLLKNKNHVPESRTLLVESQRIKFPVKWRESCMMKGEWRLINGEKLYNLKHDPGQRTNVAANYPSIVQDLRTTYIELWEELSVNDSIFERTIVGTDIQPVIMLCGQDWVPFQGDCPWDQARHILKGRHDNGYWPLEISKSGTYRISLRRWPEELDLPITANYKGEEKSDINQYQNGEKSLPVKMGEGKAIPVKKAKITIQNITLEKTVLETDKEIIFNVDCMKGNADLYTWFQLNDTSSLGAYYVKISRIN